MARSRRRRRLLMFGGAVSETFSFMSSMPANFTFANGGTARTYRDSSGNMQRVTVANTPRFDHTIDGTPLGLLLEGFRVNYCTNYNMVPSGTTGWSVTGTATVAAVADASAIAAAKLQAIITGNVIEISGGASGGTAIISGQIGAIGAASCCLWARDVTSTGASFGITPVPTTTTISGADYALYKAENIASTAITDQMVITVPAGVTIRVILNQMERDKTCSSVMRVAGATASHPVDQLQDLNITTRPYYSPIEGTIIAEVTCDHGYTYNAFAGYVFALSVGASLSSTLMAMYQNTNGGNLFASAQVASVNQLPVKAGAFDKLGPGALSRFPVALTWKNNVRVAAFAGPMGFVEANPVAVAWTGFDRLSIGAQPSMASFSIYGHLRSLKISNKIITNVVIGRSMVLAGENVFIGSGQSRMTGFFNPVATGKNEGEKAFIANADTLWPGVRNWLADGSTSGTSVAKYTTSTASNWWYDQDTGQEGVPFARWRTVAGGCANGTFKAIVDFSGEGDANSEMTKARYKTAQLYKFNQMRSVIGSVPVFIADLGKFNTGNDIYCQLIRDANRELAAENAWIYILPSTIGLATSDGTHPTDAANISYAPKISRKIANVLGLSPSGSVDGSSVSAVSRAAAIVTVTLSHPSGITDFTPTSSISGFTFHDNTTPIAISAAVRTNATTITLTLASVPSNASQTLYYGYGAAASVTQANLVVGNDSNLMPLQSCKFVSSNTGASFAAV